MCYCVRSVIVRDLNTESFCWGRVRAAHDHTDCNPTGVDDFRITTAFRWTIKPGVVCPTSADQIHEFLDGLPLHLHLDRLRSSAHAFGWTQALEVLQSDSLELVLRLGLLDHIRSPTIYSLNSYPGQLKLIKMRLTLSKEGKLEIQDSGHGAMHPPIYPFNFDSNPFLNHATEDLLAGKATLARAPTDLSLFTQHKTTHRPMYADAYESMIRHPAPPTTAEVLLYNTSEEIMEATSSTVYFQQGQDWITPATKCGGNLGTTRTWALGKGWCKEGTIPLSDVKNMHGQVMWLSNAVRGFWPARICIDLAEWQAHLRHPPTIR